MHAPPNPLSVLLDGSTLRPEQAGIKSYVLGVAGALAALDHISLHVAAPAGLGLEELDVASFLRLDEDLRDPIRRAVWRERSLEHVAQRCGASRILIPVHEMPVRRLSIPAAMVILDVGPLVAPALYGKSRWLRYAATLPRSCRMADAIVCISEATRLDVHKTLGIDPERLQVIGCGPQPALTPKIGIGGGWQSVGDEPLFLYVGSALPHKNLKTLVRAFTGPDAPTGRLVMVGPLYSDSERRDMEDLRLAGAAIEHLGFVSVDQLAELYTAATCIVLPSLHEGFGMPLLEAFQARVPIVASRISAIEEVAGNAAYLVNRPLDPEAWASALSRVAADDLLRDELVSRGTRQLEQHSWADIGSRWARLLAGMSR